MNPSARKNVSIASLVLGLIAWLGEKFGWISTKVAEGLTVASLVAGGVATFA